MADTATRTPLAPRSLNTNVPRPRTPLNPQDPSLSLKLDREPSSRSRQEPPATASPSTTATTTAKRINASPRASGTGTTSSGATRKPFFQTANANVNVNANENSNPISNSNAHSNSNANANAMVLESGAGHPIKQITTIVRDEKWIKAYKRAFPTFKFYFDSVEEAVKSKVTKQILLLGGSIEPFFSTKCTHLITTRPLPAALAAPSAHSDNPATTPLPAVPSDAKPQHDAFRMPTPRSRPTLVQQTLVPSSKTTPVLDRLFSGHNGATPGSALTSYTSAQTPAGEENRAFENSSKGKVQTLNLQSKPLVRITTEAAPIPSAAKEDIIDKAQKLGIRVWSLDSKHLFISWEPSPIRPHPISPLTQPPPSLELQRKILKTLFADDPAAPQAPALTPTPGTAGDLPLLLRTEKVFGLTTGDPRADFHCFRAHYLLVEDSTGTHRPLIIKEYPRPESKEVPWPKLRNNRPGLCPFIKCEDRSTETRGEKKEGPKEEGEGKMEVKPVAADERAAKTKLKLAPAPLPVSATLPTPAPAPTPVLAPAAAPRLDANVARYLEQVKIRGAPAFVESTASGIIASVTSRAAGERSGSARSGLPKRHVHRDRRVEMLGKRVMIPGRDEVETKRGEEKREEEKKEEGGARREKKRRRELEEEEEGKAEVEAEGQIDGKAEDERPAKYVKLARPGYCENCRIKFEDLLEHMYSRVHRRFATDPANYQYLDILLEQVRRPPQPSLSPTPIYARTSRGRISRYESFEKEEKESDVEEEEEPSYLEELRMMEQEERGRENQRKKERELNRDKVMAVMRRRESSTVTSEQVERQSTEPCIESTASLLSPPPPPRHRKGERVRRENISSEEVVVAKEWEKKCEAFWAG